MNGVHAKPRIVWEPGKALAAIDRHIKEGVQTAGLYCKQLVVKKLSQRQPTKLTKSGARIGLEPSLPWTDAKMVDTDYRNSIVKRYRRAWGKHICTVGSDLNKAPRLEYGFVGKDSKGRMVNQAPRPTIRREIYNATPKIIGMIERGGK